MWAKHEHGFFCQGAWHITSPYVVDTYIVQQGATYSAQNVAAPSKCIDQGTMTGSAHGDQVTLTFVAPPNSAGTVSVTGVHNSGTITATSVTASGGCSGGTGFAAQHIGSVTSENWAGSLDGATTVKLSAKLTADTLGNVSGSINFTGSSCLAQHNVLGQQLGDKLWFQAQDSSAVTLIGQVNANGRGVAGNYTGGCGDGTFTMSR